MLDTGTGRTMTYQADERFAYCSIFKVLAGLQAALRGQGDATTQADRTEPALNEAIPGDTRDTSTPRALGTDLRRLALGGTARATTSRSPGRPAAPRS
jgi:beta-lactamase class A